MTTNRSSRSTPPSRPQVAVVGTARGPSRRSFLAAAALLVTSAASSAFGKNGNKVPVEGKYKVIIAGYCDGTGVAHINPAVVKITGTVKLPDGTSGSLDTKPLKRSGDHFSGKGTCLGVAITITGRIDQLDIARASACFVAADGRTGRIVAVSDGP